MMQQQQQLKGTRMKANTPHRSSRSIKQQQQQQQQQQNIRKKENKNEKQKNIKKREPLNSMQLKSKTIMMQQQQQQLNMYKDPKLTYGDRINARKQLRMQNNRYPAEGRRKPVQILTHRVRDRYNASCSAALCTLGMNTTTTTPLKRSNTTRREPTTPDDCRFTAVKEYMASNQLRAIRI